MRRANRSLAKSAESRPTAIASTITPTTAATT